MFEVFDFRKKTVRNATGALLGSCGLERGMYVRRDQDGAILWMVDPPRRPLQSSHHVLDANGKQIGLIQGKKLFEHDQHFATLSEAGGLFADGYKIRNLAGRVLGSLTNESRFWHIHQTIRLRSQPSLTAARRAIVAAAVCAIDNARFGE